jgi:hypothetical protein
MNVDQLTEVQRQHLAWRLDNKTGCGLMTACKIARLETEFNGKEVHHIFQWAGLAERSAKIHAGKVERFSLSKMPG